MSFITAGRIQEAVACLAVEIEVRIGGREMSTRSNDYDLWKELTCCVLSSQVPYELARAAAHRIGEARVWQKSRLAKRNVIHHELLKLLSMPFSFNGRYHRYRFPNTKAGQLTAAFCVVREESGSLLELIGRCTDARGARLWLVARVPGVGPKQASMFLRNALGSYDLAVLDRHVLKYMRTMKLCGTTHLDVSTIGAYEACEAKLRHHAESLGHPVGVLDWAIWIVMRAASGIDRRWEL